MRFDKRAAIAGILGVVFLLAPAGLTAPPSDDQVRRIIADVSGARPEVQQAGLEKAVEAGASAVAPLAAIAAGDDHTAARAAWLSLEAIVADATRPGAESKRKAVSLALVEVLEKSADRPVEFRRELLRLLARVARGEAVPALARLLDDPELREMARWALARIPTNSAARALGDAISRSKGEFKIALMGALARNPYVGAALGALIAQTRDPDPKVRLAALDALASVGNPRAAQAVFEMVRDAEGDELEAMLSDYLRFAEALLRNHQFQAARRVYEDVFERARSERFKVAAVAGLGKVRSGQPVPLLLKALTEGTPPVREAAEAALGELRAKGVGDILVATAKAAAAPRLKATFLRILLARKEKRASEAFRQALEEKNPETVRVALELLPDLGDPTFAPAVLGIAENGPPELRRPAALCYVRLADSLLRNGDKKQALAMYKRALSLAPDDDARRRALRGIGAVADPASLGLVRKMLDRPALRTDAAYACVRIAASLAAAGRRDEAVKLLRSVASGYGRGVAGAAQGELRKLGVDTAEIARRQGFIVTWWIVGPFPNRKGEAYERSYPPEKEVALDRPVRVGRKSLRWRKVTTSDPEGRVNLADRFRRNSNVAAYAYAEIKSDKARDVLFKIGSDDGIVVWLNGERIFATNAARGLLVDQDKVKARLKAGTNRILLKILQGGGFWEFCLRVADPRGRPLDLSKLGG